MMEAICSSKMSDLTRATWCNIPEDDILQNVVKFMHMRLSGWVYIGTAIALTHNKSPSFLET
jgi:hypothetical protein